MRTLFIAISLIWVCSSDAATLVIDTTHKPSDPLPDIILRQAEGKREVLLLAHRKAKEGRVKLYYLNQSDDTARLTINGGEVIGFRTEFQREGYWEDGYYLGPIPGYCGVGTYDSLILPGKYACILITGLDKSGPWMPGRIFLKTKAGRGLTSSTFQCRMTSTRYYELRNRQVKIVPLPTKLLPLERKADTAYPIRVVVDKKGKRNIPSVMLINRSDHDINITNHADRLGYIQAQVFWRGRWVRFDWPFQHFMDGVCNDTNTTTIPPGSYAEFSHAAFPPKGIKVKMRISLQYCDTFAGYSNDFAIRVHESLLYRPGKKADLVITLCNHDTGLISTKQLAECSEVKIRFRKKRHAKTYGRPKILGFTIVVAGSGDALVREDKYYVENINGTSLSLQALERLKKVKEDCVILITDVRIQSEEGRKTLIGPTYRVSGD